VTELRALLALHAPDLAARLELRSLAELAVHEAAVEDGPDCRANAEIKARHAARLTGLPALADDSGLEVAALDGAPGVHSARFGGPPAAGQSQDARNRDVLLARLAGVPSDARAARFLCVLCLHPPIAKSTEASANASANASPNASAKALTDPADGIVFAEGTCTGRLLPAESGIGGFGYDPLFVPDAAELAQAGVAAERAGLSFGVLSADEKNRMSHRTRALLALIPALRALVAEADGKTQNP
jgi:XTP/dITP diphosphohydrolase